jgi:GlpG protein
LRQFGTLPKAFDPKLLADYLLTLGMKTRIDEQTEGWSFWIYNEDHISRAQDELQSYLKNPHDPRYQTAVDAAQAIRQKERQLDQEFRKNYRDVADLWSYPGLRRRPLTFAIVAVCVAVFLSVESKSLPDLEGRLVFSTPYVDLDGRTRTNGLSDILSGEVWRLVTPIFLHFTIVHLALDLWAFSTFATLIELRRGTLPLAALVLTSAIASNIGEYFYDQKVDPGGFHVFGGISGVVCALVGYIWMKGLYQPEQGMIIHPNTFVFFLCFIVLCMTGLMGPIANAAHVVGLVVGVAFGVFRF